MVTTNKDYEIKFETVDKLEDGNYHLLEWTVPSLGATRDEAIFNVSKFAPRSNDGFFDITDLKDRMHNDLFTTQYNPDNMISIVSVKKVKYTHEHPCETRARSVRICN
jgi:hypothetical protein